MILHAFPHHCDYLNELSEEDKVITCLSWNQTWVRVECGSEYEELYTFVIVILHLLLLKPGIKLIHKINTDRDGGFSKSVITNGCLHLSCAAKSHIGLTW